MMARKRARVTRQEERCKSGDSDDRISELPDYIFHKILSSLPTKEAARTSILSKTCLQAWQSYPILDFNQAYFGFQSPQRPGGWTKIEKKNPAQKSWNNFIECVDRSMQSFCQKKLQMKRFKIFITLIDSRSVASMVKWIRLALNSLVEELDLSFRDLGVQIFPLPQIVYHGAAASSLKALSLCNCKLSIPLATTTMGLSSLRKLVLVRVILDEQTMHRLVSGCPYTEDLVLKFSCHWKVVDLSGLKFLKSVKVGSIRKIEKVLIQAPNLEKLHCDRINSLVFPTNHSSSLRDLYLNSVDITDQCLHNLIANSAGIYSITLRFCNHLGRLKISSLSLLSVDIYCCNNLVEFTTHAPNLRHFYYSGKLPSSFRLTSPSCFASINLCQELSVTEWMPFLSNPVQFRRLTLRISPSQKGNPLEGFEAKFPRVFWRIEELIVVAGDEMSIYRGFLDSLFRVCRPKKLKLMKYADDAKNYVIEEYNTAEDRVKSSSMIPIVLNQSCNSSKVVHRAKKSAIQHQSGA